VLNPKFCRRETTDCHTGIFKMRIAPLFAKLRVAGMVRVVSWQMWAACLGSGLRVHAVNAAL
jgi:hypothetical protein